MYRMEEFLRGVYDYFEFELDGLTAPVGNGGNTPTDWPLFDLQRPLDNIYAVKILEAQIPVSYYVFTSKNNSFQMTQGATTVTITLPIGNYNSTTLVSQLSTLINASGLAATYTVSYDSRLSKLNISNNTSTAFNMTFGATSDLGTTNPRLWLGYNAGINSFLGTVAGGYAPNVLMLSGPDFLYLNSQKIGSQCDVYVPRSSAFDGAFTPILCKIPITENTGSVVWWQDPAPDRWFGMEQLYNISKLDFYFTDPISNQLVQFNGRSFNLKLGIVSKSADQSTTFSSQANMRGMVKRARPA